MKIIVFGPTGGTGLQVVEQALAAGHAVTAVARRPEAVTTKHPNLRVVKGDVLEPTTLTDALTGADVVLSALGSHSGRQPTDVYSRGMKNIRAAMNAAGVRRIVALSAVPVSQPEEKNPFDRYVMHPLLGLFFKGSYDDLRRMEADLRTAKDVDWTVLRPPRLSNKPARHHYRMAVESQLKRAEDISRADLAEAMLNVIDDPALFHKVVVVAN
jgi:putative NADH-flavin reductase